MMEPSTAFILEPVRKLWYRADPMFDSRSESALDHNALLRSARHLFRLNDFRSFGGPGCFFIQNSMILRIPLWFKDKLAPAFLAVEGLWNRLPWPSCHNFFRARWIRL
jgi:hypothetical protein